ALVARHLSRDADVVGADLVALVSALFAIGNRQPDVATKHAVLVLDVNVPGAEQPEDPVHGLVAYLFHRRWLRYVPERVSQVEEHGANGHCSRIVAKARSAWLVPVRVGVLVRHEALRGNDGLRPFRQ